MKSKASIPRFRLAVTVILVVLTLIPSISCSNVSARKLIGSAKFPESDAVYVQFPEKSFGMIYLFDAFGDHSKLQARGKVRLPRESYKVELVVDFAAAEDLSPLRGIPPDVIDKLDLSKLEVPNAQFANVAHLKGLASLKARATDLKDSGLDCVIGMKNLLELNIGETLITSQALPKLKGLTKLESLSIDNSNVADEQIESICHLPVLHSLSIARSHISDKGVRALASLPALTSLDVEYNVSITDKCMADIKRMKKLNCLKVAHSRITGASVKDIKQMKLLGEIVYSKKNFSTNDIAELRKALPNCKIEDYEARREVPAELFAPLH